MEWLTIHSFLHGIGQEKKVGLFDLAPNLQFPQGFFFDHNFLRKKKSQK